MNLARCYGAVRDQPELVAGPAERSWRLQSHPSDILLDVTNRGSWMAHCHIAEHHERGMTFGFEVEPA